MSRLFASATHCNNILSINISSSHESSVSVATVICRDFNGTVGDDIDIYIGYTSSYGKVFSGYIKKVEKQTPNGVYNIVANDVLVRAIDFFIVSNNPDNPLKYNNISAENLVMNVLSLAGLSNFNADNTYFYLGINNPVEVNLVSSYDYSRMILDIVAWSFWANKDGVIYIKNRKPYTMVSGSPDSMQPGFVPDTSSGTITDSSILSFNTGVNERDLRNKIVIYGAENIHATASRSTSYDPILNNYIQILPNNFYKAAVLASPLIDSQSFAQDAADYNLALFNRLQYEIILTIVGDYSLECRKAVTINSSKFSFYNGLWYIYQLEHAWGKEGFTTNLVLRR